MSKSREHRNAESRRSNRTAPAWFAIGALNTAVPRELAELLTGLTPPSPQANW